MSFLNLNFFAADFFNYLRLSQMVNLFVNINPIPKTHSPFSGVMETFFQEIFYLSVYYSSALSMYNHTLSITRYCFAAKKHTWNKKNFVLLIFIFYNLSEI
jgi:hypothetical protein